jgi:uncharacterized phage protein (TIGR02220 family)
MAKGKKSFTAYCDWIDTFEPLTNEEAGKLIKHLLFYVNDKNPITEDRLINLLFSPLKSTLKRDLEKWLKRCESNKTNGSKGGRPKKTKEKQEEPKKPNGLIRNPKNPTKGDSDSDSDSDKEVIINTPTKVEIDFDILLKYINLKTKRGFRVVNDKVKRSFKARLKEGYTKDDVKNAIINSVKSKYHKESNYQFLTPEFFSRSSTLDKYCNVSKINTKDKVSKEDWQKNPWNDD